METLHFFGVFDGHGGADAAVHCAQTLHQRIVEAVAGKHDLPPAQPAQAPAAAQQSPSDAERKALAHH